ncbi:MAG: hypothetical protein QNJ73_14125, partial [Gammaproteobacteria bacterium]|nr:hypothetical protein [Gammaproteobacteria bacterium]
MITSTSRTFALVGAAAATFLVAAPLHAAEIGKLNFFGSVYAKFLDGDRRFESALYNNAETTPGESGGDQGQGIEFELLFSSQVSSQVEIGGRIKARFNRNFWTNFGGFGPEEEDERSAQYMKLRGVWARITPGYDWIDSATIGSNDWGMFDPWTVGKFRYIDRDNSSGLLFQGTAFDNILRWDLARVSLARLFQGPRFLTTTDPNDPETRLETNDAAWILQLRWAATDTLNLTGIFEYILDEDIDVIDEDQRDGQDVQTRYSNTIIGLKGQYSGFDTVDIKAAGYYTDFNIDESECVVGDLNGDCRFSPTPGGDVDDFSFTIDIGIEELFSENFGVDFQIFRVGSDFVSVTSARREQDVLLTTGSEGTWGWGRPDYNFGNRSNGNSRAGLGYGGWNPETQQVVSLMADNDFTDFDEPMAETVIGWQGITIVPRLVLDEWEFTAEYSYIDFDTNWQACGGQSKDDCIYNRQEGTNSWGLGGAWRSPYSPYQERERHIFALTGNYTLDVGKGVDLAARFKYISDEDERVTNAAFLTDAYDGFPDAAASLALNPDWVPNVGLDGCVQCDDRSADYYTFLVSAGYQLTRDLYVRLLYQRDDVDLIDGTIDVAPVGLGFEGSNDFGYAEYLTGEHEKNRIGAELSYFLSGVEFGGSLDWIWGSYTPEFLDFQNGQIVRLDTSAVSSVAT